MRDCILVELSLLKKTRLQVSVNKVEGTKTPFLCIPCMSCIYHAKPSSFRYAHGVKTA